MQDLFPSSIVSFVFINNQCYFKVTQYIPWFFSECSTSNSHGTSIVHHHQLSGQNPEKERNSNNTREHMETSRLNIVLQGVNVEDGAGICAPHFKVFHREEETKRSRGNFGKPVWKSVKQIQHIYSSSVHCRVQRMVVVVVMVGYSRQAERHNSLSHVAAKEHLYQI